MGLVRARRGYAGDDERDDVLQLRPLPPPRRARREPASLDHRQRLLEREPLRKLRQRSAGGTREQRSRAVVRDRAIVLSGRRRGSVSSKAPLPSIRRRSRSSPLVATVTRIAELPCSTAPTVAARRGRVFAIRSGM